jgi:UMF1 family MFS transporter
VTRWLARAGLGSKPLVGWALYDWANSAFYTIVITAVYPVFFDRFVMAGAPAGLASRRHALATTAALVVSAVLSPLLGVVADSLGAKKRLLGAFLGIGVVSTASMAVLDQGESRLAMVCFFFANLGIVGSLVFYDSLLPHVVGDGRGAEREAKMDRASSAGYAIGYLGGGVALLLGLVVIAQPERFGFADTYAAMRAVFLFTALWWAVFSLPLFRWVPEPAAAGPRVPLAALPRVTVRELATTFRHLRRYRQAFLLLVAVAIYMDGVGTIVRMAASFATDLKIGPTTIIATILAVQFAGFPFAFLFGALGERIGAKRALLVGLSIYVGISVYAWFVPRFDNKAAAFVALGLLVATVQGGVQALSRSLFASFVPPARSSEFFGFFSVFEKFAGILGPAVFALVIASTGSSRSAILAVVVFFVVGGALLLRVDVEEGRRTAQETGDGRAPAEPVPAAPAET